MINFSKILLIFLPVFLLSSCFLNEKIDRRNNQKQEVLLASECGMDGLKCCAGDPKCLYGQECCVDPNNPDRNYCADKCSCGGAEEFCCAGEIKCDDGLRCFNGNCRQCGKENEPCCEADILNLVENKDFGGQGKCLNGSDGADLICYNDKCAKCGEPGGPCCENRQACFKQGGGRENGAECRNGVCVNCGGDGEAACSNKPECSESHFLNNGICLKCGGANQPCCQEEDKNQFCDDGLKCELGFCKE